MSNTLLKDVLGWGLAIWFVGYAIGFVLFFLVPPALIGWVLTPVGVALTLMVLAWHVERGPIARYALVAAGWTGIAILGDYVFIVLLLEPADGYYKPDVYLYYALTFLLPLLFGWRVRAASR